jgi:hypothetical protein
LFFYIRPEQVIFCQPIWPPFLHEYVSSLVLRGKILMMVGKHDSTRR